MSIFYLWPPQPPLPPSPSQDWRQHKVIFMNGGGGHEESVTWVLAEAERGMLVHCCCFVVNLVRGYTAARLVDAFYQLCQVTSSRESGTYSASFYASRHRYPRSRGEVVVFFGKMFWHSFLNCSSSHGDIFGMQTCLCSLPTRSLREGQVLVLVNRRFMLTYYIVLAMWTRVGYVVVTQT